jgi:alginate O-acetyltransferase complex protein AlgI
MLFNSFPFLLIFLPISLIGFYAAAAMGMGWARAWLVVASFAFYTWWHAPFTALLLISIAFNFSCGMLLKRTSEGHARTALLVFAVGANLGALFYYKYAFTLLSWLAHIGVAREGWTSNIILPLGISFFTFTQIGYLLDSNDSTVTDSNPVTYALFVTFFPHLIAGPILHHREIMPQFANRETYCFDYDNFIRGFCLFVIGMAKKVCIADTFSGLAVDGFAAPATLSALAAWSAVLCYSLELYFDFSGYSDMAIGVARMFNVKFPLNFNSPYKATSIIEFWSRFHMTFTRYLTLYLFNPLAIRAQRRLAAKGVRINRKTLAEPGPFVQTVAIPIFFTMILAGIWHGAGLQFLIFGVLHGCYLVINHTWRVFGPKTAIAKGRFALRTMFSGALTYFAVLVGQVFFRASSTTDAFQMLGSMAGLHGVGNLQSSLRVPDWFPGISEGVGQYLMSMGLFHYSSLAIPGALSLTTIIELSVTFAIVWWLPNSQTILHITDGADRLKPGFGRNGRSIAALSFNLRPAWGICIGALTATVLLEIGAKSEFLYFQF